MSAKKIARTALAVVILSWAGWELLDYWFNNSSRKEFAQKCQDSGMTAIIGHRGMVCAPKQ